MQGECPERDYAIEIRGDCRLYHIRAIAKDADVYKAQKKLLPLGYDVGSPDGVLGKKTANALRHIYAKILRAYEVFVHVSTRGYSFVEKRRNECIHLAGNIWRDCKFPII